MKKQILLALLLFVSTMLQAQAPRTASVFFETDQSELSEEARKTLDALAPELLKSPDYSVNIEAFTDDRGATDYNLRLAADRAAAVQNYLAGKGLIADKTSVKNWGEDKAAGSSEEERRMNRRVDININAFLIQDFAMLRARLAANTEQVLPIEAGKEQSVTAAKGTIVIVPANAFVFDDGAMASGKVDLVIQEAFDPADFLQHNLTTLSDGRILQTGGMVNITARSGERELRLAPGASLTISIPNGSDFDPNMELFYAQPAANGSVDWKPAGQKFRRTLRPARAELTVSPEIGRRIATIKVSEYPKPALPAFVGQMPPEPKVPSAPYKPRPPKKPEWDDTQRMFAGGGSAVRMSRKEAKKAQKYFREQLGKYERDSAKYVELAARYERNMAGYQKAKERYNDDRRAWEQHLQERLTAIMLYQRELYVHYYSRALPRALKKVSNTILDYNTYSDLEWKLSTETADEVRLMMLGGGMFAESKKDRREGGNLYESVIGTKVMDNYKDYARFSARVRDGLPSDTTERITRRMFAATGIENISDSLKSKLKIISDSLLIEARENNLLNATTTAGRNYALQNYVATISQLGWINCDRFYNDPAEKMQLTVAEPESATLYAVCNDIRAMLPFSPDGTGNYVAQGLPKGRSVTVVAIKLKDGVPQYAQQKLKVGDAMPALAYRSLPMRDLREELKKLNI